MSFWLVGAKTAGIYSIFCLEIFGHFDHEYTRHGVQEVLLFLSDAAYNAGVLVSRLFTRLVFGLVLLLCVL